MNEETPVFQPTLQASFIPIRVLIAGSDGNAVRANPAGGR